MTNLRNVKRIRDKHLMQEFEDEVSFYQIRSLEKLMNPPVISSDSSSSDSDIVSSESS
jgi:hypothetical protein